MSSILTNNGAMIALQTLKSINNDLGKTQSLISTGKSVGSAKDNSAVWAISKQMTSDVKGFKAISESLGLGQSTVAVARNAAETVTDLLTEIKGKIVASQEENVDRAKIQTDITALRNQIKSVIGAAQFNGLNLVNGLSTENVEILSSLDRSSDGSVATGQITVERQDLSNVEQSVDSAGTQGAGAAGTAALLNNANATRAFTIGAVTAGVAYSFDFDATDADGNSMTVADYSAGGTGATAGQVAYVAKEGDTSADVAKGLAAAFAEFAAEKDLDSDIISLSRSDATLTFTTNGGLQDAGDQISIAIDTWTSTANVASGGLGKLEGVDVSTSSGAAKALVSIESLIQTAIDSAAAFGSAQGRIETQTDFISALTDSLKSGIGTLVDADMEEASARLQALQVQQQLGIQSLSIANQAPQSILSLFR